MHPSFRKLLDGLSRDERMKPEFSNSTDPASELDPRVIRSALGYDPDDESVEVRFIPATGFLRSGGFDLDALLGQFGRPDGHSPEFVTGAVTDEDNIYGRENGAPPTTFLPEPETGEDRWQRQYGAVGNVMNEVYQELRSAFAGHRDMTSSHEGYAVILEELDELWELVKRKGGGVDGLARKEALQVAAMAIRYVVNLDPHD